MEPFYSRPGQSVAGTTLNEDCDARHRQRIFQIKRNGTSSGADSPGGVWGDRRIAEPCSTDCD